MSAPIPQAPADPTIAHMQPSIPPDQAALYQEMYDKMSCRPPVKRNYFPVVAVSIFAVIAGIIYVAGAALM